MPAHLKGVLRERKRLRPQIASQLIAMQRTKPNAGLLDSPSLTQRLLALLGSERGDEVVESPKAPVVPMELTVVSQHEPCLAERLELRLDREQHMSRRTRFRLRTPNERLDERSTNRARIRALLDE